MVKIIENHERAGNNSEKNNYLPEQCHSLEQQSKNILDTSQEKQNRICQNYGQLPANPKSIPTVNQLEKDEETEVAKNNKDQEVQIEKTAHKLNSLADSISPPNLEYNNQAGEEVASLKQILSGEAMKANATDASEIASAQARNSGVLGA